MKKHFVEYVEKVYVVFVDENSLWWLRFLKKGYRHCYVLLDLDDGMTWLELNPMSNRLFIKTHNFLESVDYISYLSENNDLKICEVLVKDVGLNLAPISCFSCVSFVKRLVGLHNRFLFTPYQLFSKLMIVGKKS